MAELKEPEIGLYIPNGDLPAEEKLRVIRDAGFDFVCTGYEKMTADGGSLLRVCDSLGLPFENVHLTGDRTNVIWGSDPEAEEICERYCRQIRECAALGVHTGIVHVTWGKTIRPEEPGPAGFERYRRIGETAAECGFTVCVENSIFPGHFFSVLDRFTGPEFAHCFDCGHWNAFMREYPVPDKYAERVAATHIHDNDGRHDLHLLPFDGAADWDLIARKLAATPFGRRKICSESAGTRLITFKNLDAKQIERILSRLRIHGTDNYSVDGNSVLFYGKYSYEEIVNLLYGRMKRLASMVAEEAQKSDAAAEAGKV